MAQSVVIGFEGSATRVVQALQQRTGIFARQLSTDEPSRLSAETIAASRSASATLLVGDLHDADRLAHVVRVLQADPVAEPDRYAIGVIPVLHGITDGVVFDELLALCAGVVCVPEGGSASLAEVVAALVAVIDPLPSMNHVQPHDLREILRPDRPLRAAVVRGSVDAVFAGVEGAVVEAAGTSDPEAALCVMHLPVGESWQAAIGRLFAENERLGAGEAEWGFYLLWCYEYHDEADYRITVIA